MNKTVTILLILISVGPAISGELIEHKLNGALFRWDLRTDDARLLKEQDNNRVIWQGGLLAVIPFGTGYLKLPVQQAPKEVYRVYPDKSAKTDYVREEGKLVLEVDEEILDDALVGFIIHF